MERIIFPDSTILLDYMITTMQTVIKNLVVHKENMLANLGKSRGMIFSQGLLLKLIEKGLTREAAYKRVQDAAKKVWENGKNTLEAIVLKDKGILKHMSPKEIKEVFHYDYHLKNVDEIFKRVGISGAKK